MITTVTVEGNLALVAVKKDLWQDYAQKNRFADSAILSSWSDIYMRDLSAPKYSGICVRLRIITPTGDTIGESTQGPGGGL